MAHKAHCVHKRKPVKRTLETQGGRKQTNKQTEITKKKKFSRRFPNRKVAETPIQCSIRE